jgi:hypothetical protein
MKNLVRLLPNPSRLKIVYSTSTIDFKGELAVGVTYMSCTAKKLNESHSPIMQGGLGFYARGRLKREDNFKLY